MTNNFLNLINCYFFTADNANPSIAAELISELPPEDKNGKVIPVTGASPKFIIIFVPD